MRNRLMKQPGIPLNIFMCFRSVDWNIERDGWPIFQAGTMTNV